MGFAFLVSDIWGSICSTVLQSEDMESDDRIHFGVTDSYAVCSIMLPFARICIRFELRKGYETLSLIDDLLAQHSEWVEQLNGFVSYRDFVGSFSRTYPSIAYLLTGVQEQESMPFMVSRQDYLSQAWKKTIFLPEIHESGAQIGLYTDFSSVVGVIDNVDEMVDNIGTERVLVDREKMLKKMLDLSAYRYLPEAMKPYFQIYTGDLREAIFATEDNMYRVDDYRFWDNYRKTGLTVNEKLRGTFRF